jgi:hypothetical protein
MKYFIVLLFFSHSLSLLSQESWRFRENNSTQIESIIQTGAHGDPGFVEYKKLLFSGDTVVDGKHYEIISSKVYARFNFTTQSIEYFNNDYVEYGLLRKDTLGRVYIRFLVPVPNALAGNSYAEFIENEDNLLYDFNLTEGDTVAWKTGFAKVVNTVDSITLESGEVRKRIVFYREDFWEFNTDIWIEGIGSTKGLLGSYFVSPSPPGPYINLTCSYGELEDLQYDFWLSESSIGSSFDCLMDNINTTTEEAPSFDNTLNIYPNPTALDEVTVASSYLMREVERMEVTNSQGQLLANIPFDNFGTIRFKTSIAIIDRPGVYWVTITLKTGDRFTKRLIKM